MNTLVELIESTKQKINMAVNRVLEDTALPAYLVEGIILGILADVRERKMVELMAATHQENGGGDNAMEDTENESDALEELPSPEAFENVTEEDVESKTRQVR